MKKYPYGKRQITPKEARNYVAQVIYPHEPLKSASDKVRQRIKYAATERKYHRAEKKWLCADHFEPAPFFDWAVDEKHWLELRKCPELPLSPPSTVIEVKGVRAKGDIGDAYALKSEISNEESLKIQKENQRLRKMNKSLVTRLDAELEKNSRYTRSAGRPKKNPESF